MNYKKYIFIFLLLIAIVFSTTKNNIVKAQTGSCYATVSPTSIAAGEGTDFEFNVTSSISEDILWIKIIKPSSSYTVNDYRVSEAWDINRNGNFVTFTNGVLVNEDTNHFVVEAQAGEYSTNVESWIVQASIYPDGSSPVDCGGVLGAQIVGGTNPPSDSIVFTNVSVSDITSSQAKIAWNTIYSLNSKIDYGLTTSYGSTKTDNSYQTSHTVVLDSLSASSTYHFRLKGSQENGSSYESVDYSFATPSLNNISVTTETINLITIITPTPSPTPMPDRTPPQVELNGIEKNPYKNPPELLITATDNSGIEDAEISLDNGKNWTPVKLSKTTKTTNIYSFSPPKLLDGNYNVLARARDNLGNIGTSKTQTLVIDFLPPEINSVIISYNSMLIPFDKNGNSTVYLGSTIKISGKSIGGTTSAIVKIENLTDHIIKEIGLTKVKGTDFWSGEVLFDTSGEFNIKITSQDGAENIVSQNLFNIRVMPSGIIKLKGSFVKDVKIKVFKLDQKVNKFYPWDAEVYGLLNPIYTNVKGEYGLLLPEGTSYVEFSYPGYIPVVSKIINLNYPSLVYASFELLPKRSLNLFGLNMPFLDYRASEIELNFAKQNSNTNILLGQKIESVSLELESKEKITLPIIGQNTEIFIAPRWHPNFFESLKFLDNKNKINNAKSYVILEGETVGKLKILNKLNLSSLIFAADPEGKFLNNLKIYISPLFISIDQSGYLSNIYFSLEDYKSMFKE